MHTEPDQLRVALLSGNLGIGGAEKQMVYVARALRGLGVTVRIYYMRPGEFWEPTLKEEGFDLVCLGLKYKNPVARLAVFVKDLRRFKPHIVHSCHFWTNAYAAVAGRLCGAMIVGSLRNSLAYDFASFKRMGPWLVRCVPSMVCNSYSAGKELKEFGLSPQRIHVLPNSIDLNEFDACVAPEPGQAPLDTGGRPVVIGVGRMVAAKRFDRYIRVLAQAREKIPSLLGVLIGDGPELKSWRELAQSLDLEADSIRFLGRRSDVAYLLKQACVMILTSDYEGTPNTVLEAMAARLPVIATPAGDAKTIVQSDHNGYLVAFEDVDAMADHLVRLMGEHELRSRLGQAGRTYVEQQFGLESLPHRIVTLYRDMANHQRHHATIDVLSTGGFNVR